MSNKTPVDFLEKIARIQEASVVDPVEDEKLWLDMITHADAGLSWLLADAIWRNYQQHLGGDAGGPVACLGCYRASGQAGSGRHVSAGGIGTASLDRLNHGLREESGRRRWCLGSPGSKGREGRSTADTIEKAVKARLKSNRKDSLHSARQYVAMQLGVSYDSVRRATPQMKPRKKTKK